jgi:hypothetical protein
MASLDKLRWARSCGPDVQANDFGSSALYVEPLGLTQVAW